MRPALAVLLVLAVPPATALCTFTVPVGEVEGTAAAAGRHNDETLANAGTFAAAATGAGTRAAQAVVAGLPGTVVFPFDEIVVLIGALGDWNVAQIWITAGLVNAAIDEFEIAAHRALDETFDCVTGAFASPASP